MPATFASEKQRMFEIHTVAGAVEAAAVDPEVDAETASAFSVRFRLFPAELRLTDAKTAVNRAVAAATSGRVDNGIKGAPAREPALKLVDAGEKSAPVPTRLVDLRAGLANRPRFCRARLDEAAAAESPSGAPGDTPFLALASLGGNSVLTLGGLPTGRFTGG